MGFSFDDKRVKEPGAAFSSSAGHSYCRTDYQFPNPGRAALNSRPW